MVASHAFHGTEAVARSLEQHDPVGWAAGHISLAADAVIRGPFGAGRRGGARSGDDAAGAQRGRHDFRQHDCEERSFLPLTKIKSREVVHVIDNLIFSRSGVCIFHDFPGHYMLKLY